MIFKLNDRVLYSHKDSKHRGRVIGILKHSVWDYIVRLDGLFKGPFTHRAGISKDHIIDMTSDLSISRPAHYNDETRSSRFARGEELELVDTNSKLFIESI